MVTWLTDDMLSDKDVAIKELLDLFPLGSIKRAKSEGSFAGLKMRACVNFVVLLLFIGGSVVMTALSVSAGWLTDRALAIVPTMGCIFIGAGVTASAIFTPRLFAAMRLHKDYAGKNFPTELLVKYCGRFAMPTAGTVVPT